MFYHIKHYGIAIITTFLLGGCALFSSPQQQVPLNITERQQKLEQLQQFTLQASVGIKVPDESLSGSLRWQQQQQFFQAAMTNFLGVSMFELSHDSTGSEILIRGERYQAEDASSLLYQLSGWSMPLNELPLWIRGLPGRYSTDILTDEHGRVSSFSLTDSAGIRWQLSYNSFFNDALSLPKNIVLKSHDTQIKIVIRSWQL